VNHEPNNPTPSPENSEPCPTPVVPLGLSRWNYIILSAFLAFAVLFHLGRIGNRPVVGNIGDDAANIASFCAAYDHPELFVGDGLLGNPNNIKFYATIHLPLTRWLAQFTGNYERAFLATTGAWVFLYLSGYYLAGLVLVRRRLLAVLFAIFLFKFVPTQWSYWGFYNDPLPAATFNALFGFVLALFFRWEDNPRLWPLPMMAVGGLMYVHPVSAPIMAFAIWLGLAALTYRRTGITAKGAGWLLLCGAAFLAVSAPFVVNYLAHHQHGVTKDPEALLAVMRESFSRGYVSDFRWALKNYVLRLTAVSPIIPMGVLGSLWILVHGSSCERKRLWVLGAMLAGILFCALGIFFADHGFARLMGRMPVQLDLIRGMRFVVPICLIAFFLGLAGYVRSLSCAWKTVAGQGVARHRAALYARLSAGVVAAGLMFAFVAGKAIMPIGDIGADGVGTFNLNYAVDAVWTLRGLQPIDEKREMALEQFTEAIQALHTLTPERATILSCESSPIYGIAPLAIRYGALRPVSFTLKDGGALGYSNLDAFRVWAERRRLWYGYANAPSPKERSVALLVWANTCAGDFLLVSRRADNDRATLVAAGNLRWENEHYSLIGLKRGGDVPTRGAP
jgi:hypothetical protein